MHRFIAAICIALVPVATAIANDEATQKVRKADEAYFHDLQQAQEKYRKALAEALAGADKIEVFSLDSHLEPAKGTEGLYWEKKLPDGLFPIAPYRAQAHILARTTLTGDDMKKVLGPLQTLVGTPDDTGGALCHNPPYGIRVWSGDEILFQSSFCWHCHNYYVNYLSGAEWVGMTDTALKEVLDGLPLIAQKEAARPEGKPSSADRKPGKSAKKK